MKKQIFSISILLIAVIVSSCAAPARKGVSSPLHFAVVGNTCPESPFKQTHSDTPKLIAALNRDNPSIVIHTGNAVFAGFTSGVREEDVAMQFKNAAESFDALDRARHFVPGELDTFSGSTRLFSAFTEKDPYNTFTYGSLLFIILNTTDPKPGIIGDSQFEWLADTLAESGSESIIIVMHHPLYKVKGYDGAVVDNAERIISLIEKYPVRAVISGAGEAYSRREQNNIEYYSLGCVPLYKPCVKDQNRYYMATFFDSRLFVEGKKL